MRIQLEDYLKNNKTSVRKIDDENAEVCDLNTGVCHTIKVTDGLISRNEDIVNRKIQVETITGIKQLLND